MKLGLTISWFDYPGGVPKLASTFGDIARNAEKAGFYSVWVMDHFFQIPYIAEAEHNMLEGYSALAYLAGITEKVKLGTMVTGVTYRYPGLLAKTAATLDVLSQGRSYLGIGAAWFEREHLGLGVPYPPLKERFEMLEETLQIALQMWSGEVKPYHGKHYRLEETLCLPLPLSKPHPPILIGGTGEKKTLRMVAQYAQACNIFCMEGPDFVRQKLDVLRQHCTDLGRPYSDIEKTGLGRVKLSKRGDKDTMTPQQVIDWLGTYAEVGIDHMVISMEGAPQSETFELMASDVMPHLNGIKVSA